MNPIQLFASQPWIDRLGWTLVHFLWQGVLISALYAAARRWVGRSASPNTRYVLACGALAAMMAVPLVTLSLMNGANPVPLSLRLAGRPSAASTVTATAPVTVRATVSAAQDGQLLPWVVVIWIAGAMGFGVRLTGGWVYAAHMRSTRVRPAPQSWQQILSRLGARIGLSRRVRLLVSAVVQVPTVVGWIRPVVLVPVGALAGLPPEYMEALLIHELAHIRRHDYVVNILQRVAEALLFYHPAVWWVSGHIRIERELCCDDVAVSVSGDVLTYARALAELESFRPAHFGAAVAGNGGNLADRIGRLLGQSRPVSRTLSGPGILVSAVLIAVTACTMFGRSPASPRFAFASINPNFSQGPKVQGARDFRTYSGGRLTAEKAQLGFLIQNAYGVKPFQIVEGPEWAQSSHYDIEAQTDLGAASDQMPLMLQALLEDTFKLIVHRETRKLPVYVLTTAASGLKLQRSGDGVCRAPNATMFPPAPPPPPPPGQPLSTPSAICGRFSLHMNSISRADLVASRVSMAELTAYLSTILGLTVIDKTGFSGTFDVHMTFTPDKALALIRGSGSPARPADAAGGSIFTALQEQLGLKLESAKGPVEVLVIDHVEKPTSPAHS